jgi:uncharacterized protein YbaP (TraB family)
MHNYNSYLVRHWLHRGDSNEQQQIFDIEHIQSGRRMRLESLSEALPWIEAVSLENREIEDRTDRPDMKGNSSVLRDIDAVK